MLRGPDQQLAPEKRVVCKGMKYCESTTGAVGAQWLSGSSKQYILARGGRVLELRPRGHGFEPHWRHCLVSLSKNINPSLVLVQPRFNCLGSLYN